MQLGIFAKTFDVIGAWPVFNAVRSAGFDCAQINMASFGLASMPEFVDQQVIDAVVSAHDDTGVAIVALSGTYNMIHPDPVARLDGLNRLRALIRSAPSMGIRLVTLCTGTRDPNDQWHHHPDNVSESAWRDLLLELEKAIGFAEQHDVDLGVEPEPGNVVATAETARRLIDSLGSSRIRIILDSANICGAAPANRWRELVEHSVELLHDRIAIAHAKDRDEGGLVVPAGRGAIDFHHFIGTLHSAGFDGPLVTHGLRAQDAPRAGAFLRSAIETAEALS